MVVSEKNVHEGKYLMSSTCGNDLVNKRSWEVVLGTCQIKTMEICTDADGTLFFIHGNRIRNPSGVCNGVDEANGAQLLNSALTAMTFEG